jgi:hypothetical protein
MGQAVEQRPGQPPWLIRIQLGNVSASPPLNHRIRLVLAVRHIAHASPLTILFRV